MLVNCYILILERSHGWRRNFRLGQSNYVGGKSDCDMVLKQIGAITNMLGIMVDTMESITTSEGWSQKKP